MNSILAQPSYGPLSVILEFFSLEELSFQICKVNRRFAMGVSVRFSDLIQSYPENFWVKTVPSRTEVRFRCNLLKFFENMIVEGYDVVIFHILSSIETQGYGEYIINDTFRKFLLNAFGLIHMYNPGHFRILERFVRKDYLLWDQNRNEMNALIDIICKLDAPIGIFSVFLKKKFLHPESLREEEDSLMEDGLDVVSTTVEFSQNPQTIEFKFLLLLKLIENFDYERLEIILEHHRSFMEDVDVCGMVGDEQVERIIKDMDKEQQQQRSSSTTPPLPPGSSNENSELVPADDQQETITIKHRSVKFVVTILRNYDISNNLLSPAQKLSILLAALKVKLRVVCELVINDPVMSTQYFFIKVVKKLYNSERANESMKDVFHSLLKFGVTSLDCYI